jgi:hypothetical protein
MGSEEMVMKKDVAEAAVVEEVATLALEKPNSDRSWLGLEPGVLEVTRNRLVA